MTFEQLKKEAEAHGYRLVQKHRYERLMPCVCGSNRREHWYDTNEKMCILKCSKCGRAVYGKTEAEAKRNWNQMVVRLKIGSEKISV